MKKEKLEKQEIVEKVEVKEESNKLIKKTKCKILDKFKVLKEKYKNFNGISLKFRILTLILVVLFIVLSSFIYNESGLTWDITRIAETKGTFSETSINDMLINCGFTLSIILILYAILGSLKAPMIISIIIWVLVNILNAVVTDLRGTPFTFADIFSAGTALSVLDGMEITFSARLIKYILINLLVIIGIIGLKFGKLDTKKKKIISRILSFVLAIVVLICGMSTSKFQTLNYWDLDVQYRDNGMQMVFIKQIDDFFLSKPEGYSVKKAEEILARYEDNLKTKTDKEKSNVIIIMNESFADLKETYGIEMEDNIPYYNSLKENVVKGTVYSSVLGGGTATAEWELLTGNSCAFLPNGAIPYIVYLRNNRETLVSNFNSYGYETVGMHCYYGKCYNRKSSYKKLGFDKGIFMDDMRNIWFEKSNHPSDEATYNKLIEAYEARDKEKNFFGFVLTMQNHAPYTFEEYKTTQYFDGDPRINQYLTLVKKSDEALEKLIEYYSDVDERTVILFFGDHQPKVAINLPQKEWLHTQIVPYMVWANYDIEEKEGEDISTNFLSTLIYEYAGVESTCLNEFLKDFRQSIPVFTSQGYKDKDGKTYEIDDVNSPYKELIDEYKILEYYFMFDHEFNKN